MSEFFNTKSENNLLGLKEFLERKYKILMEKIASSSALPSDMVDIAPKSRAPARFISFDADKHKRFPIKIRTAIDTRYDELFHEIEKLAGEYFDAAQKALRSRNASEARDFIDEAIKLLTDFELPVPEEFTLLNAEILSKFPVD